ncbi:TATA box-binding protein-associated factor RNA polymerase I subunit A isoform X2 [Motacilla alba alba]|uniref:TATA box-binding protein-associated factor RNA polymerase I subunit A isoform X2 n=1 Tax=Motacilla alba alba TaxID=1094192 RepID=UPI0018D59B94|nr:TATA box-binding protein-associated factor RNA polymerase I subunit A isoform X2 [Motacilla alba alba]
MDSFLEEDEEAPAVVVGGKRRRGRSPATQAALQPPLYLPFLPPQPVSSNEHKLNFKKSKEACLSYIQDALLQKQWKRAAEFLTCYVESLEKDYCREHIGPSEMIWRIGTEILWHHSQSRMKEFSCFMEQMKTLGVKRYLKVCLEHVFHLLCNGQIDEAYQNLSLAESWRFGEQTAIQDKEIKLVQAYRGLLDYCSWSKQKKILLEHGEDGFADLAVEQEMHSYFRKAAMNLKEIIKIPGVWDVFVKCYVDILHDIVPSHKLMIDFNTMLQKSKKRKKRQLGLQVIFAALDYAGWKENAKAWNCLARQVKQIVISEKHLDWIKQEWNSRKDWWPAFHFSRYLAKRNWQENKSLSYEKALVAGILLGKDCKYFKYVSHQSCKAQLKRFWMLKKFVTRHNPVYLRISGPPDSSVQP